MKLNVCRLIKDKGSLKAYNKMWDKISKTMQTGFDSEAVFNQKYLKTKIKP